MRAIIIDHKRVGPTVNKQSRLHQKIYSVKQLFHQHIKLV